MWRFDFHRVDRHMMIRSCVQAIIDIHAMIEAVVLKFDADVGVSV